MRRSSAVALVAGVATLAVVLSGVTLAGPATAAPNAASKARSTHTSLAPARATVGKAVTLTATVRPEPKSGTVRFTAGGRTLASCGSRPVGRSTGRATCRTTFRTAGRRTVVARYSGAKERYRTSSSKRTVTVAAAPKPKPKPAAVGSVVGPAGSCTTTTGALVAVDYRTWTGPIVRGCDPAPTTGIALLTTAGFTTAGTQHDGPQFVCRIGNPLFAGGTQYPTPATEKCVSTPSSTAYWSFWLAKKGANTWTYSTLGAYSDKPVAGEVEAWVHGGTDVAGSTGRPAFTPNQVRAGLPAAAAARPATASRSAAQAPTADLAKGVSYLVSQLSKGEYYDPYDTGYADFGLTVDGALALAATGTDNATLAKIVAFFDSGTKDGAGRNADGWTGIGTDSASGGSIAKEALLAEATGNDPRSFGGHDLIKALDDVVCTAKTDSGCAAKGNYLYAQSTFSQALGVIAQLRAGDTSGAAAAIAYLESIQKSSGAFSSVIPTTGDSDVDSTALAAMALELVGGAEADAAVSKALAWIATKQESDGGFPGAAGDSTNSAALAIQGLGLDTSTYRGAIRSATAFLARLQNSDGGFAVAASGGDSDVRASTQVVGGLVGTSFATLTDDVSSDPPAGNPNPDAGAAWLVGKLVDGDHLEYDGGFGPDFGNTANVAIALASTGTQDTTLTKIVAFLAAHVADYADPDGKNGGPYAGSLGKLAVVAEIAGQDPHAFGGYDLLAQLSKDVCAAPGAEYVCTDAGDFTGAYSTTSQSLDVLAFERAGETPPAAALARLTSIRCSDGGFPSILPAPGATDCTSDVDSTGFALQALAHEKSAGDVVAEALAYLRTAQNDDGSWTGAAGHNSNSTALAVQGLLAAGAAVSDPAVQRADTFLAGLQNADGGFGISAAGAGSDILATSQTVPAAAGATLTTLTHPIQLPSSPGSGGGSGSGGTGSGSSGSSGGSQASGGLASTGVPSGQLLVWALLMLLVGTSTVLAGRTRGGRQRRSRS